MRKIQSLEKSELIKRYPALSYLEKDLVDLINIMAEKIEKGGKILAMGNGGSSSDAEHFCGELMKGFLLKRPLSEVKKKIFDQVDKNIYQNLQEGISALSLGVSHAVGSAFSNDVNPDYVFAQQVYVLANENDMIMGISTSGNSKNVVNALKVAKALGVFSFSLTGEKASECSKYADITLKAPSTITHIVQESHLPIYHAICIELESLFFAN